MLYNYLNSNEALRLNESFKLYITILSIAHENFKKVQNRKHKKRTAQFYASKKIKVGASNSLNIKKSWLLDVPNDYPNSKQTNIFKNKCLILAFALALLQHAYFENLKVNKTFLYVQNINSKDKRRQTHAGNLLLAKCSQIIAEADLPLEGPYDLMETVKKLHDYYKAQFFIFSAMASKRKLLLMYPPEYDDTLKPIFLFKPHLDSNHIVFIRNIRTFFQSSSRTCLACLKSFSTMNYNHLCNKKEMCFSCRRFFRTNLSYVNSKLHDMFCDKLVSNDQYSICSICNVTLFSAHCAKGHKRICNGKGHFGWKCRLCNKFYYRYGSETSNDIKNKHSCGKSKRCRNCLEPQGEDHLCKLNCITYPKFWPKLAFISICFWPDICFPSVQPLLWITYIENDKQIGLFDCKLSTDCPEIVPDYTYNVSLNTPTYNKPTNWTHRKLKDDFTTNMDRLLQKKNWSLTHQLLCHLLCQRNTTFICNDENSLTLVRINHNYNNLSLILTTACSYNRL